MFERSTFGCFTTGIESLTQKQSRIAERTDIRHSEKMDLIGPIRSAHKATIDKRYTTQQTAHIKRLAAIQAAKTPEQRAEERRKRERDVQRDDRFRQSYVKLLTETALLLDSHPVITPEKVEVIERPFEEHITKDDAEWMRGLNIRID
ncbi:hypothetical protein [Tunturiibacter gelidiferens]|uniref:hypothetical protein n=1 Tax=Tunturiibacter gelidiferens TaxID=3069689 RepID=UPI003D9ABE2A